MAMDIKPEGETLSHQFAARFPKGGDNSEEFERRLAEFMRGFIECYPHYIIKREFDSNTEDWIFKFYIEKV